MSTNQVIHGTNRVVENPNRYKLNAVAGQPNVYDLEKQAGVITDNGTPYNKIILDKIDNVLSYLTPSVEKVVTPILKKVTYFLSFPSTISGNSFNTQMVNDITSNTIPITFNATGSSIANGYRYYNGATKYYIDISSDGSADVSVINQNCKTNNMLLNMQAYQNSIAYMNDFTIDMTNIINAKLEFEMSSNSSTSSVYIEYSTNGNDYTILETITQYTTYKTINIPNNSYLRVRGEGGIEIGIFKIYVNENIPIYQNQFTLDNNTSFTNNQRVLLETPKESEEEHLTDYVITSAEDTISAGKKQLVNLLFLPNKLGNPKLQITNKNTDFNLVDNGSSANPYIEIYNSGGTRQTINNTNFVNAFSQKSNTNGYVYFANMSPITQDFELVYDLKHIFNGKINFDFSKNVEIYTSVNGIEWNDLGTYINDNEIEFNNIAYIKFVISIYETKMYYCYFKNLEFSSSGGMSLDGVESNTLNGVDIDTLLQPSTKYELIYKEDINKFELGGAKVLFDITLSEAVNQVDLTGISDMLEDGKLYMLYVNGGASSNTTFTFGDNYGGYLGSSSNQTSMSLFISYTHKTTNKKCILDVCGIGSNVIGIYDSEIETHENIKMSSTNTFNAGTRIIIKEVA